MIDIVNRLRFDAIRCEATFSKGVAGNVTEGADEIERLREAIKYAIEELDKFSDFMGAEGHFTYAKEIKGMVLPKLTGFLGAGQSPAGPSDKTEHR